MPEQGRTRARILGTGCYVPEKILTNADLERIVETTDEWITTRTGIKERHVAAPDQASSDLACEAAVRALDAAGVKATELDLIVVATVTPDTFFPSTGCRVQDRLGAPQAAAFDLSAACSGFVFGLHLLRGMVETGVAKRVLLVGVETLTKITDYTDRGTCVLFGDGAGAVVLGPDSSGPGILSSRIGSAGQYGDMLCMPGGGSRHPATCETVKNRLHYLHMKGNEVFKLAVRGMEEVSRGVMEDANLTPDDMTLLIPHQANIRMITATADRLGMPMEKVFVNIHKYGNTSSASVPIALDEAVRSRRVKSGDILGLVAFGGGLTWGATALRW